MKGRVAAGLGWILCLSFLSGIAAVRASAESLPSFTISPLFPLTQGLAPYADPAPPFLKRGEMSIASALTWTNTLRVDDGSSWPGYSLIVDGETLVYHSSLSMGLGSNVTMGLWYEASAIFPGIMDPALSAFHHALGFANQWRDFVPPNLLSIEVLSPAGVLANVHDSGFGLDSLGAGLDWKSTFPFVPSLGLKVKVPVPSPAPFLFGALPAIELTSAWEASWERLDGGLALGMAWQAFPSPFDAIPHREWLPQASARLFITLTPALSIGGEAAATESPYAIDEWYLGGIVGNVWAGLSARLTPSLRLETAVIEELASWASIEVGFQAGLRWNGGFRQGGYPGTISP